MKAAAILIIPALLLTGCSINSKENLSVDTSNVFNNQAKPLEAVTKPETVDTPYSLYIGVNDYAPAPYEDQGCYLGANIINDKIISSDITEFEKTTGKEHPLYANEMKLGSEYPSSWVLECVAKGKLPVLTIYPPEDAPSPFDPELLLKTAEDAGKFNIPVFIQFYPYKSDAGYKQQEYIKFYREAHDLFKKHAPGAAFIWGVYIGDVYECLSYYPGKDYVDWAGLNIPGKISLKDSGVYTSFDEELNYFYYSMQKTTPIIIADLSVSHFSTANMQYYVNEAAAEINKTYKLIAERYPRIKAVIYNNYNELAGEADIIKDRVYENYTLEELDFILEAYKDGINNSNFVSSFDPAAGYTAEYEYMLSPFVMYKRQNEYYIAGKSLEYDMDLVGISSLTGDKIYIDGRYYYNIKAVQKYISFEYDIDEVKGIVKLSKT